MSVAKSYAKALFEEATDANLSVAALDTLESQLSAIAGGITGNKAARTALFGPVVTAKEKTAVVHGVADKMGVKGLLANFLELLARRRRLALLGPIAEAFAEVRLASEGGVSGKLVAAEKMTEKNLDGLAKAFSKKLGKKISFRVSTDPTLLAGMKVTVSGVTYDGTLRSQLQRLRDRLLEGAID